MRNEVIQHVVQGYTNPQPELEIEFILNVVHICNAYTHMYRGGGVQGTCFLAFTKYTSKKIQGLIYWLLGKINN